MSKSAAITALESVLEDAIDDFEVSQRKLRATLDQHIIAYDRANTAIRAAQNDRANRAQGIRDLEHAIETLGYIVPPNLAEGIRTCGAKTYSATDDLHQARVRAGLEDADNG